jgi:hypothetical protein
MDNPHVVSYGGYTQTASYHAERDLVAVGFAESGLANDWPD